ncbi:hypothetical protein [Candidatus Coxiella mudrowiae]|uniref:hypothetical protein n=1 Tax=Candidatus Coxiella mudrowiae TaxID=2054173 RepID=UPI001F256DF8|nr:hypothetical protein [Candidatus Coxiella mudrowiae]
MKKWYGKIADFGSAFESSRSDGHSLIIYVGGDNYSDHSEKLGGGGAQISCAVGVIR